jgi:hypothetical protein
VQKYVSSPNLLDRRCSPPYLLFDGFPRRFSRVKSELWWVEADFSLPSSAWVKNDGAPPLLPHMSARFA